MSNRGWLRFTQTKGSFCVMLMPEEDLVPLCLHDRVIKSPPAAIQLWTIYQPKMSAGCCSRNSTAQLRRSGHCRHVKRINKSSRVSRRCSQYISLHFFCSFTSSGRGPTPDSSPSRKRNTPRNLCPAKCNSCTVTGEFVGHECQLTSTETVEKRKRGEAGLVFSCSTGKYHRWVMSQMA